MIHLNSNLLCAVAINTTGPDAQKHELLEIAVIPLNSECNIDKSKTPFNILFKPERPERAETNLDNELMFKCVADGFDLYDGANLFEAWFEKLELRFNKKIMVLCHNWAAKRDFIKEWLQPTAFNMYFHHEYRDAQAIGLYLNDVADKKNERYPFPKVKLGYMASQQKVEYIGRLPTVIDECQACINLYKSLLMF